MPVELRILDPALIRQVIDFLATLDEERVICPDCGTDYLCTCHPDCPGRG